MVTAFVFGGITLASTPTYAEDPAPDEATAKYEIDFMKGMIDHHAMAIEMASMCLEKTIHEELRTLCQNIITAQQMEIAEMQSWLSAWYGISYPPEMNPGEMRKLEKMQARPGRNLRSSLCR